MRITSEHLMRMKVPKLYWHAKLSEIPEQCPHKKHLAKYISNLRVNLIEGRGLLLYGEYSTGKSASSCILLKAAASLAKTGLFVRASQIAKAVFDKTPFDDEQTLYARMLSVDLLVIDELIVQGTERTQMIEFLAEDIIRERISEQRAIIITSNQSPKQIASNYPALAAVLTEAVLPIKFDGYNFRKNIGDDIKREFLEE